MGIDVPVPPRSEKAPRRLTEKPFAMVISDIRMPEMSGIELLKETEALEKTGGNQTLTAEYLYLTKPSLHLRIQPLGIDPVSFKHTKSVS